MAVLPPGTLLQLMYLGERLKTLQPGRFIEIGPGGGEITNALLRAGWTGTIYELSDATVAKLHERFAPELQQGRLAIVMADFFKSGLIGSDAERADLIISSMVMEHLDPQAEQAFMVYAALRVKHGGHMIGLVPASPAHWGIEDEIAGHYRRYDRKALEGLLRGNGWTPLHIAGLTFPVSNLLFPISNLLVRKHEANKLKLSMLDRTKQSGNRSVSFKTSFPPILGLLLNRVTMLPLHWLQKLCAHSDRAMVLYFEAAKDKP